MTWSYDNQIASKSADEAELPSHLSLIRGLDIHMRKVDPDYWTGRIDGNGSQDWIELNEENVIQLLISLGTYDRVDRVGIDKLENWHRLLAYKNRKEIFAAELERFFDQYRKYSVAPSFVVMKRKYFGWFRSLILLQGRTSQLQAYVFEQKKLGHFAFLEGSSSSVKTYERISMDWLRELLIEKWVWPLNLLVAHISEDHIEIEKDSKIPLVFKNAKNLSDEIGQIYKALGSMQTKQVLARWSSEQLSSPKFPLPAKIAAAGYVGYKVGKKLGSL